MQTELPPSQQIVDNGPTRLSTSSAHRNERKVPPEIGRIVGELGLRFPPNGLDDLAARSETLRLLTLDLADQPPVTLQRAAERWASAKPFLPKASDLIALVTSIQDEIARTEARADAGKAVDQLQDHCDRLNRMRHSAHPSQQWTVAGHAPHRFVTRDETVSR